MRYAGTEPYVIDPGEEALRRALSERGIDVDIPNVARIYDVFLGGKDNFQADRDAAEELSRHWPPAQAACLENRAFLGRVVASLAEGDKAAGRPGIRQFLDLGSGLPAAANVHQIAQEADRQARVVYADYDPVVVLHSKVLLEGQVNQVLAVKADLRDPESIIRAPAVSRLIDFSEPVAVLMFAILHFIPDRERPDEIVRCLIEAMAPGSVLALSHVTPEQVPPETREAAQRVYQRSSAEVFPRSYEEIARLFDGLEMTGPGLVNINYWPEKHDLSPQTPLALYGGAGIKR